MSSRARVLLVLGHPRPGSFCEALAAAYCDGAMDAGAQVRVLRLAQAEFDPDVHAASPEQQPLEPVLAQAQQDIVWAQHLVFVHPVWWGSFPARLKGFLDRCLTPGFAFAHREDGAWEKLLAGRTAELITTLDTPRGIYRLVQLAPGHRALAVATLGYCGVRTVRQTEFGPVVTSAPEERREWLRQAHALGLRLRDGVLSPGQRAWQPVAAWLRALRLQFHPMAWLAYTMAALAAAGGRPLDLAAWALGLLALFLLEAATVFCNDWFDRGSDAINRNAGPFTGGSRVLVDGSIAPGSMGAGIALALAGFVFVLALLVEVSAAPAAPLLASFAVLAVLALGYTVPPLKLSHRGLGELAVALTHSAGVMLPGWLLQGGDAASPLPWLLGVPLAVAVFPAIVLSGVPDHDADRAAAKRTLVVKLGIPASLALAAASALLAAALGLAWWAFGVAGGAYSALIVPAAAHALWLAAGLRALRQRRSPPGRIDALMARALGFTAWFAIVPLASLLG
ncbi:NAD(P)H-dependent oxidoreductase [Caldimonas tepidiphila]|uniref:NAD(P)H-dependent oxidoreductase n=1 Tax=Caldimonas tepidiphila TaxID=2315841 RepID=UPI000E5C4975|nr:NAD(P)H-dependent oxidoreductase [Caldimonas tepidiphila]